MKKYILFALLFLFIVQVQAINIGQNVTLNTSVSNSSFTFSSNTTVDRIDIYSTYIYLTNLTDTFNNVCDYNQSEINTNVDISGVTCISSVQHGGGSGGVGGIESFEGAEQQVKIKDTLIKVILWVLITAIFIVTIFILDVLRRDKKLRAFAMTTLLLIIAVSLAIAGLLVQGFLLYKTLQFSMGIMILMWILAFLIFLGVLYMLDIEGKSKKINLFLKLTGIILVLTALFIGGWLIQNTLLGYNMNIKLTISIVGAIAVFLIIIAFFIDQSRRKR